MGGPGGHAVAIKENTHVLKRTHWQQLLSLGGGDVQDCRAAEGEWECWVWGACESEAHEPIGLRATLLLPALAHAPLLPLMKQSPSLPLREPSLYSSACSRATFIKPSRHTRMPRYSVPSDSRTPTGRPTRERTNSPGARFSTAGALLLLLLLLLLLPLLPPPSSAETTATPAEVDEGAEADIAASDDDIAETEAKPLTQEQLQASTHNRNTRLGGKKNFF